MNPQFPIPVSFIMGEDDWVRYCDEDKGQDCVNARLANHDESIPKHERGYYHFCPTSGHNMQMDNPQALSNLIINELLGDDLPVLQHWKY